MTANPEGSILASELRYRRLFESAKDGILILDARDGTIVDANPFMTDLLGYEHRDFLGKELWQIGLFADQAANRAAYEVLQETGYIRYEHLPLKAEGGREVEVEFISNVYYEGEARVIQCNIRDITERRRLERQVQEQGEALADADRRKDEFLAILSHELRNPLAAILNAVQIFQLGKEEDPTQEKAKAIVRRQVGQLTLLVDDLLEVTRITTGAVVLRLERCDAVEIVRRAVDGLIHLVSARGHKISVSMPPGPIWVNADAGRIEQVVVNLVGNAAKYTDAGGRIEVSVMQEGAQMVLRVRDTGIGISAELLPNVFNLFTQADRSLDRSQGGLGIGLTIVQRLVKMHGGTVEARSRGLGLGSEFIVRLPSEGDSSSGQPSDPKPRGLRVLVVDDNVDYADGVAVLLQASGYQVEVVHNGPDALLAVAKFQPDVVVLDIGLPGMDGYEVARRIREEPTLSGTRIVGVSGYREEREEMRSSHDRFDSYLLKPVLLDRLEASFRPESNA
ncbi:PAS domain-containing hybrid sensor histidine kinase/response regulator [Tundrisphaera lichenicola]|uniref:PAS domain-containing hybrid sensor histidine kinase/response regulator n=1 Tax=Tundrisphaera lichenicola TaxID=2029860 RepID=UPI003EBD5F34